MNYENQGKYTYPGLWRQLLFGNESWINVLRSFYPDKPLWHLHLFIARYWGVNAITLHWLQKDLENFTQDLKMDKNVWKDPISHREEFIKLSYIHFGVLDSYVRFIAVQANNPIKRKPDERKYDRIYQVMFNELWQGQPTLNKIIAILYPTSANPPDPKLLYEAVKDIANPIELNARIAEWISQGESAELIDWKSVMWLCCQGNDAIAQFHGGDFKKAKNFAAEYFSNDPPKSAPSAKKAMQNYTTKIVTKTPRNRKKIIKAGVKNKLLQHVQVKF